MRWGFIVFATSTYKYICRVKKRGDKQTFIYYTHLRLIMPTAEVRLTYTVIVDNDEMTEDELIEWIDENHIQGGLDVGLQNDANIEHISIDTYR